MLETDQPDADIKLIDFGLSQRFLNSDDDIQGSVG